MKEKWDTSVIANATGHVNQHRKSQFTKIRLLKHQENQSAADDLKKIKCESDLHH
jgi:hypothetical protein